MTIAPFAFQTFSWSSIPKEEHKGETGTGYWQIQMLNDIRIRLVEYTPGYIADHWCSKGHVLYCFEGEMETELEDGRILSLTRGMCYLVGDNNEAHRSSSKTGCKVSIVD